MDDLERENADLRRKLAKREAELAEALAQQTATDEVLGIISSSRARLERVFEAVLVNAVRICGGTFGMLALFEGGGFRGVAAHGVGREWIEVLSGLHHPPPGTGLDRLQKELRTAQIADCAAEPAYDGVRARNPAFASVRTALHVPMLRDSELIGAIAIYRGEVRAFGKKEIEFVENFAAQAVIAIENTRLIKDTREALEQQTATAEVLGVINSSPGDLAPVFDAILEKAHLFCGAVQGAMYLCDGDHFYAVAQRGHDEPFASRLREGFRGSETPTSRPLIGGEAFVHIPDLGQLDHPIMQAGAELAGTRTLLSVPLRKGDALLGMIVAARREASPFTDKQIALLQNFAAHAVIAMENARLITETREALEQQTATAEVLGVINASPGDLAPVFRAMLEKALRLCEADLGNLLTYDGECFQAVVGIYGKTGVGERELRRGRFRPWPGGPLERLVSGEHFTHSEDVRTEVTYQANAEFRELVDGGGYQSMTHVALRKESQLLGAIVIFFKERRQLTEKQIALLQNFAAQAVIAMENARLLGELRQRTEEVAELNRGLEARVAEQVEELGRVGRLKRFLAPQLAELIVSQGDEKILESHRREIVVVFCDLRGYTAFTETAEPEEVLDFLREYHGALGPLVAQFEGTLDQFSGDGIMVFFNDPMPIPDPAERAVTMAVAMRAAAGALIQSWRRRGRELGFGVGIAQGYATLGQIGFAERSGYTAIGTVCNLAARLCAEAKDGQILIAQRVAAAVEHTVALEEIGLLTLKGLTQPVVAFDVPLAANQPTLRVIEGGPQSA